MKKLYFIFAGLLSISLFQSCSKESVKALVTIPPANSINVTLAPNQSYELNLNSSGIISVSKQASHYKLSETALDAKSGFLVYKYVPAVDYTGNDEVILSNTTKSVASSSGGGCNNGSHDSNNDNAVYNTSYTVIKLNISN